MESRAADAPSIWAVAFGASVVAGLAGYFLGTASSIGVFGGNQHSVVTSSSSSSSDKKAHDDIPVDNDGSASETDESDDDQEVSTFEDSSEECKLVLVVRTDLGMTKGTYHFFSFSSCILVCLAVKEDLPRRQCPMPRNRKTTHTPIILTHSRSLLRNRQDSCSVFTCNPRMLQDTLATAIPDPEALGKLRSGKGCAAGQERRGA